MIKMQNEYFSNERGRFEYVYNKALNYLHENKPASVTDVELEKIFVVPDRNDFKTKDKILERLFGSLQNYQSMKNVIGFYTKKEERASIFRKIFFNYDDKRILDEYKTDEDLLDTFAREFDLDRKGFKRKNNSWVKYSRAVLSASRFMSQFEDAKKFEDFVDVFFQEELTMVALPLLLSKEIYGLGFAIGCDFLKEIGYGQYPKPDVHLIDIFSALGLSSRDELDCYKAIVRMADYVVETPFKVDKVFWLIGSGEFGPGVPVRSMKKEFIEYMKKLGV